MEPNSPRAALGQALVARADDVAAMVRSRWDEKVLASPESLATIADSDRLATQLVGRWLVTGESASEEEHARLATSGALIDTVPLPRLLKSYLVWRDTTLTVLAEEAARLGSPPELIAEASFVVRRSCDASMVRMSRQFEAERTRLHQELSIEREKLAHQALHDPLTGLPNRTLLYDRMAQALRSTGRYGGTIALLFVDLDDFKVINDAFGHEAGDALLVDVARRLRAEVRLSDTAARLGGDEFIVLCERLDERDPKRYAVVIAERLLVALRRPFELHGKTVSISASIGIAVATGGEAPDALVSRADGAMYQAKSHRGALRLAA
jgi:diguanylate cyclase (GGDEF)-like protein